MEVEEKGTYMDVDPERQKAWEEEISRKRKENPYTGAAEEGPIQKKAREEYEDAKKQIEAILSDSKKSTKVKAKAIMKVQLQVSNEKRRGDLLADQGLWSKALAALHLPLWTDMIEKTYRGVKDEKGPILTRAISEEEYARVLIGNDLYSQVLQYNRGKLDSKEANITVKTFTEGSEDHDGATREDNVSIESPELLREIDVALDSAVLHVLEQLAPKYDRYVAFASSNSVSYNFLVIELLSLEKKVLADLLMPDTITALTMELSAREDFPTLFSSSVQVVEDDKLNRCFVLSQSRDKTNKLLVTIQRIEAETGEDIDEDPIVFSDVFFLIKEATKFVYDGFVYWRLVGDNGGALLRVSMERNNHSLYTYKVDPRKNAPLLTPLVYDDVSVVYINTEEENKEQRYCSYAIEPFDRKLKVKKTKATVCDLSKLDALFVKLENIENPLVLERDTFDTTVNRLVDIPVYKDGSKVLAAFVPAKVDPDDTYTYLALVVYQTRNTSDESGFHLYLHMCAYTNHYEKMINNGNPSRIFDLNKTVSKLDNLQNFRLTFLTHQVFMVQYVYENGPTDKEIHTRIIQEDLNMLAKSPSPPIYELGDMSLSPQMKHVLGEMIGRKHYMLYYNPHGTKFNALFYKHDPNGKLTRLTLFKEQPNRDSAAFGTYLIVDKNRTGRVPVPLANLTTMTIIDFLPPWKNGHQYLFAIRDSDKDEKKANLKPWLYVFIETTKKTLTESKTYDLSRACAACNGKTTLFDLKEDRFYCNTECRSLNNMFSRLTL